MVYKSYNTNDIILLLQDDLHQVRNLIFFIFLTNDWIKNLFHKIEIFLLGRLWIETIF
jgi:hypothetical protein